MMTAIGAAVRMAVNRNGMRVGNADLGEHLTRRGGVRLHQLDLGRVVLRESLGDLHEDDEEHSDADHDPAADLAVEGVHVVEHPTITTMRERGDRDRQRVDQFGDDSKAVGQHAHRAKPRIAPSDRADQRVDASDEARLA